MFATTDRLLTRGNFGNCERMLRVPLLVLVLSFPFGSAADSAGVAPETGADRRPVA